MNGAAPRRVSGAVMSRLNRGGDTTWMPHEMHLDEQLHAYTPYLPMYLIKS